MAIFLIIVAIVVLTVATIAVSRMGAVEHQEDLNSPGVKTQPTRDRPAGPGAEDTAPQRTGDPGPRPS